MDAVVAQKLLAMTPSQERFRHRRKMLQPQQSQGPNQRRNRRGTQAPSVRRREGVPRGSRSPYVCRREGVSRGSRFSNVRRREGAQRGPMPPASAAVWARRGDLVTSSLGDRPKATAAAALELLIRRRQGLRERGSGVRGATGLLISLGLRWRGAAQQRNGILGETEGDGRWAALALRWRKKRRFVRVLVRWELKMEGIRVTVNLIHKNPTMIYI